MRRTMLAAVGLLLALGGVAPVAQAAPVAKADSGSTRCEWTQWGMDATHAGQICGRGPTNPRLLARIVVDPFSAQEAAEAGSIPVHYMVPLVDNDGNVFALRKGGEYVSCDPPGSGTPAPCGQNPGNIARMTWSVQALRWQHGQLVPRWTYTSDWKPIPAGGEALFQPAMGDKDIYLPGAGGTVIQLDKNTGRMVRRINPFGGVIDAATTYVAGGLTVDQRGALLYNAVKLGQPDVQSWLVRATRNRLTKVDYSTLIPDAPKPTDLCRTTFPASTERPLPPPPQADGSPTLPPLAPCLSQRPGLSVAPAVGPDGRIVTVTRANLAAGGENYGYVVTLNPDLSLAWAASLRGHFNDGCGVLATGRWACREGATVGVDPSTNLPPAAGVSDGSSASAVILPDGGVVYGARNAYNDFRGHLMKFDRRGHFKGYYDFGWDITPGVVKHGNDYSLVIKDNHYQAPGPFNVTQLGSDMRPEWSFTNTETRTCERLPDDTISCVDTGEFPNGFEWCISAPAIDRDGNVYGLSEDGNFYVIDKSGRQRAKVFLSKTIAAAYTPVSLDNDGHIYAQNNGELYVLGR